MVGLALIAGPNHLGAITASLECHRLFKTEIIMIEIICVYTEMIYQGLVIDFNRQDRIAQICVDGSFYARVNLSDFDVCRLRSCVRPFDAVDNTAGLDEVRALGPNQISELVSPDSASGCPNFSSF